MAKTTPIAYYRTVRRELSIVALVAIAGLWAALPTVVNAAGTDAAAGKQVFEQKCAACHTVGGGNLVGPDLKGVTALRSHEWLQKWISAPDQVLANKDPIATKLLHEFHGMPMPNLHLSATEVDAAIAYLATSAPGATAPASGGASAAPASAPAASAPAVHGDPAVGQQLFTGTKRFSAGGPSCMACHSVGGIGALGGGQLGPDLTTVVTRFGGVAGVNAFIRGLPTPTMNAVWSKNPPTDSERADVVAFLAQAAISRRPTQAIWQLAGLSLLGLLILLAIAGWVWRGRTSDGVRRPMIAAGRRNVRRSKHS